VPHQICQVVKPPFQSLDPLSIHGAIRLEEGNVRLQGLDQVQLSPPSLLQLMNSKQDLAVIIFEALDHRLVTFQPMFIKANPTSQRGQVLIDSTEDSSGISYTLTPLSLQSISLIVHQLGFNYPKLDGLTRSWTSMTLVQIRTLVAVPRRTACFA